MSIRTLTTAILCLFVTSVTGQTTYLHCGQLVDVEQGEVLSQQTIIVTGEIITGVEAGYTTPEGGSGIEVIDLREATVMPGLFDMHVHLEHQTSPTR